MPRQIFRPVKPQLVFQTSKTLQHKSAASKLAANPPGHIAGALSELADWEIQAWAVNARFANITS